MRGWQVGRLNKLVQVRDAAGVAQILDQGLVKVRCDPAG